MITHRLFRILYCLLEKERVTAPELAQKMEVSVRTIYRVEQVSQYIAIREKVAEFF